MAERSRGAAKTKGKGTIGCLFCLAAFIVIILLFLINMGKIKETLEKTNFNEIVRNQRGTEPTGSAPVENAPRIEDEAEGPGEGAEPSAAPKPAAANQVPSPAPRGDASQPAGSRPVQPGTLPTSDKPKTAPTDAAQPGSSQPRSRLASLYFIRVYDDGMIAPMEVKRRIPASDSPLTDAIAALLQGPTLDEQEKKLMSLKPDNVRLIGAKVQASTAILNFNEEFRNTKMAIPGAVGWLKQVVYTATSFPNVQDVQILIEGAKHYYLTGEGIPIDKPLSRNSF
jgi:germination protein M